MTLHEALLTRQGFAPFRRAVAMLCMALAFMLSWQSYISLMDRLDHAHHHTHFANPLAGDISYCAGSCGAAHHSHEHKLAQGVSAHHHHHDADASADHHDSDAPAHQHNGDAAIVFLAAQTFVLAACTVPTARCESGPVAFVTFSPRGPDHPPKSIA